MINRLAGSLWLSKDSAIRASVFLFVATLLVLEREFRQAV